LPSRELTAIDSSSSASEDRQHMPDTRSTTSARSAGFEAYAQTDNVAELTAGICDEGWDSAFAERYAAAA
jgi:hypothetical protein